MIKFTAKLADGKKRKLESKSSWAELTFRDLLRIENESEDMNPLLLFSILTGVTFDDVANSKDDNLFQLLSDVTRFITHDTPKWDDVKCPEKLFLKDRYYDVPLDISQMVNGQKILLAQLIAKKGQKRNFEIMPRAVAIMMTEPIFGKFDKDTEKKIDEIEQMILDASALSVYGAGRYFFLNSPILLSIGKSNLMMYHRSKQRTGLEA